MVCAKLFGRVMIGKGAVQYLVDVLLADQSRCQVFSYLVDDELVFALLAGGSMVTE